VRLEVGIEEGTSDNSERIRVQMLRKFGEMSSVKLALLVPVFTELFLSKWTILIESHSRSVGPKGDNEKY
jgi:hypothetical protein